MPAYPVKVLLDKEATRTRTNVLKALYQAFTLLGLHRHEQILVVLIIFGLEDEGF